MGGAAAFVLAAALVPTAFAADTRAPTVPTGLRRAAATPTSVTLAWSRAKDNVRVAGYGVYRGSARVGRAKQTTYTIAGLACSKRYRVAVDAYDAAGNRSRKAMLRASTEACPSADTTPPSMPADFRVTGATTTSLSTAWTPVADAASYALYRDSASAGTTAAGYTFSGLTCGTSYTLAVEARDGAGNASPRATLTAATAACPSFGASLYLSPGGSDANPCSQSAPCLSFQRAYDLAEPGATVELAAGTYPGGTVTGTKAAPAVVFRPAAGAAVSVTESLSIDADQIEFRDLRLGDWQGKTGADHVTFRNVVHNWFTINGSFFTLVGGEVVPEQVPVPFDYDPSITEGSPGVPARDVLIDGVYFHDWRMPAGTGWHVECLQVGAGERVTIRNSTFRRCAVHDIFVRSWGDTNGGVHVLEDFLIENNWFDVTDEGSYAMQFLGDLNPSGCTGNVVRYNTSLQEFTSADCGIAYVGNLGDKYGSGCHSTYRYNVWFKDGAPATTCSETDKGLVGAPGFVDLAGFDLHLRAGSPALNAGDPFAYPERDRDGESRPLGGAPDAGADEAG